MRNIRVGGFWLKQVGGWADLRYTHEYPRGCSEASWTMEPDTRHQSLYSGALVEIFDGGQRIWRGRLNEPPSDGQFSANGSWSEASDVLALDGSGNATKVCDTAIDAAIARGAISWTRPASINSSNWGVPATSADAPMKLLDLLDQSLAGNNRRWWIDPDGNIQTAAEVLDRPVLRVPHAAAGRGLTLADDNYYSHLTGRYFTASATYGTITVGNSSAATKWRRKEAWVDLSPMGVIVSAQATTELTQRLNLTGARMGFAENLNLGYGEITTLGGVPVPLSVVRATGRPHEWPFVASNGFPSGGLVIRLVGVWDRSRVTEMPYTDIMVAKTEYTEGSSTVLLVPQGKAPRDLTEILSVPWNVSL